MTYSKKHLAYCSNVHPGEDVSSVINNIKQHFLSVREKRQLEEMASGLWLSAKAVNELLEEPALLSFFKQSLNENGVLLTSLNGFPYGDFHQAVVKQNVYLPTWAQAERLQYTKNLATILATCLPEQCNKGAISTLPLAYADTWDGSQHQLAINQFIELAQYLAELEVKTGKKIVICIEMEPDCVLQHTHELVNFFKNDLLPAAITSGLTKATLLRYIGCCYDTCHQAVMNENITDSLTAITALGIDIAKIQISNAVNAKIESLENVQQLTALFQDQKFLHQTKVFSDDTLISELADLEENQLSDVVSNSLFSDKSLTTNALITKSSPDKSSKNSNLVLEAKVHYHIPINQTESDFPYAFLSSTQTSILETLDFLTVNKQLQPCLEIETYTWLNFLETGDKQVIDLHEGLAAEFYWLEAALTNKNLL